MRLLLKEWDLQNSEKATRRSAGVCVLRERVIKWASDSLVKMLGGRQADDLVGKNLLEFVAPNDRQPADGITALEGGLICGESLRRHHFTAMRLDQSRFDAEIQIESFTWQGQAICCGIIRDVGRLQLAVCGFETEDGFFRTLIEAIPCPIFEIDRSGTILNANNAFRQLFHQSPKGVRNTCISDFAMGFADREDLEGHLEEMRWQHHGFAPYFGQFQKRRGEGLSVRIDWGYRRTETGALPGFVSLLAGPCGLETPRDASRHTASALRLGCQRIDSYKSAIDVLLEKRKEDKKALEDAVTANIVASILPTLEALFKSGLTRRQKNIVTTVEARLRDITAPFASRLSSRYHGLSPMEIRVASLIRDGMTNKEIADILHLSNSTILTHRHHIRNKLGLKNKKVNLQIHLRSLGQSDQS